MLENKIRKVIRDIPDFPKEGIIFKDITPILLDPILCNEIVEEIKKNLINEKIDAIAGVESRGFLFGLPLAMAMEVPFVIIRKKGKLPYHTVSYKYDLEYGNAEIEMHVDAIKVGDRVLIHDDLLATGGTAAASAELVKKLGGEIAGFSFLVELDFLKGRSSLEKYSKNIQKLTSY